MTVAYPCPPSSLLLQVVRQRAQSRFTNISSDLRRTRKALIQEVVDKLRDMHYEG